MQVTPPSSKHAPERHTREYQRRRGEESHLALEFSLVLGPGVAYLLCQNVGPLTFGTIRHSQL